MKRATHCRECGIDTKFMSFDEFASHLVASHGYQRDAHCIWKPKMCRFCGKTALYKVGGTGYCKDHLVIARARREQHIHRLAEKAQYFEKSRKEQDIHDLNPRYATRQNSSIISARIKTA